MKKLVLATMASLCFTGAMAANTNNDILGKELGESIAYFVDNTQQGSAGVIDPQGICTKLIKSLEVNNDPSQTIKENEQMFIQSCAQATNL